MINTELLEQTMRHIIDHPETHNQGIWVSECGTTACFAGWACLLSEMHSVIKWKNFNGIGDALWISNYDTMNTYDAATKILGLNGLEADRLFYTGNTVDDIQIIVKDIINNREAS